MGSAEKKRKEHPQWAGQGRLGPGAVSRSPTHHRSTCAILVHLHGPVVHLSHGLHLNVVAMAVVFPLPVDVGGEVLCDIVGEVVSILHLQNRSESQVCAGRGCTHSAPAPQPPQCLTR